MSKWCPSDKRVRCINCRYLYRLNSAEAQCRNEDGPVAMWMFLDNQEPSQCWCEAFQPQDWLGKQGDLLAQENAGRPEEIALIGEAHAALARDYNLAVKRLEAAESRIAAGLSKAAEMLDDCDAEYAAEEIAKALKGD